MRITTEQLQRAVANYFDEEIGSRATGFKKFASYFMMASLENKIPQMASKFADTDGYINVDDMYNNAKMAIKKSGQFVLWDIIFDERDVDKLYSQIERVYNNGTL